MINRIVESAIQNQCLSVASEGLLCQVVRSRTCSSGDLNALQHLLDGIERGDILRESRGQMAEWTQGVRVLQK